MGYRASLPPSWFPGLLFPIVIHYLLLHLLAPFFPLHASLSCLSDFYDSRRKLGSLSLKTEIAQRGGLGKIEVVGNRGRGFGRVTQRLLQKKLCWCLVSWWRDSGVDTRCWAIHTHSCQFNKLFWWALHHDSRISPSELKWNQNMWHVPFLVHISFNYNSHFHIMLFLFLIWLRTECTQRR